MTRLRPPRIALAGLAEPLGATRTFGALAGEISAVVVDSRDVRPGALFVAVRGARADGHAYLAQAIANGAAAIVVDDLYASANGAPASVATFVVARPLLALSRAAALLHDEPSRALRCIGITGTNGKTTTTRIVAEMLVAGGIAAGTIGTLGARFGERTWPLANTTPLAHDLQALLAAMRDGGARAVAMEVSSHALAQGRAADVAFSVAALTNVTRDHLDYHETFEAYAAAKRSLFDGVPSAVLNLDDPLGRRWARELAADGTAVHGYGFANDAELRADDVVVTARGSRFRIGTAEVALALPGRFNVHNALCALGIARLCGVPDATSIAALRDIEAVPGRMEHLAGGGIDVIVDYAHTPDALERVLAAAREVARGTVTVVFGCGGDRDRGKRPEMGRLAARGADAVVVTNDNPRGEDPRAIAEGILAGIDDPAHVRVELDRRAAIERAIADARSGDLVVIAGKGHETYQIAGDEVRPFDDREIARAALARRAPEPA